MHFSFLLTGLPALLYLLCRKYQFFLSVYTLLMFPDINHRPSGCNQLTVLYLIHERTALSGVNLLKRSDHQWVTSHPTNVYNRGTRANLCIGRTCLEKHSALCSTIATGACVVIYVNITVLASHTPLCLSNCGLVSSNPSPSSLLDEMLVLCTWSLAVYLCQTQGEVMQPQQAHLSFHWIYSTIQPDCWGSTRSSSF